MSTKQVSSKNYYKTPINSITHNARNRSAAISGGVKNLHETNLR